MLYLLFVCTQNLYSFQKKTNYIYGHVYFDENKNGIKNDFEKIISGVRLILSNGKTTVTNELGEYSFEEEYSNNTSTISIDKDSLPGGSILTTPERHHYSSQKQFVTEVSFGIYYPKEDISLYQKNKKLPPNKKNIRLHIYYDQFGIRSKNKYILKRKTRTNRQPGLKITFKTNRSKTILDKSKMEQLSSYLENEKLALGKATIMVPDSYTKEDQHLVDDVKLLLSRYQTPTTTIKGSSERHLTVAIRKNSHSICYIQSNAKKIIIGSDSEGIIELEIERKKQYQIICDEQSIKIKIPQISYDSIMSNDTIRINIKGGHSLRKEKTMTISSRESYLIKLKNEEGLYFTHIYNAEKSNQAFTKPELILAHSKYLHLSRDLQQHFEIKKNNNTGFTVNGRTIRPKDGIAPFIIHSKRGLNTLELESNQKKYQYHYQVMEEPSFMTSIKIGQYSLNRSISDLNTDYTLDKVIRYKVSFDFYPKFIDQDKSWGVRVQHAKDLDGVNYIKNTGQSIIKKQQDLHITLRKRMRLNPQVYRTLKYNLGAGYFKRKLSGPSDITVFIPKDLEGLSADAKLTWENIASEHLDLSFQTTAIFDLKKAGNYIAQVTGEASYSLNQLGQLLPFKSFYSSYYRYKYLDNFNLLFSLTYENSKRSVLNSTRGELSENSLVIQSGISWKY